MVKWVLKSEDIVLDFFSGSCSTAHAVLELNSTNNSNNKFICVQLPQEIKETDEVFKEGFKKISDLGKERIRRVINKLKESGSSNMDLFKTEASIRDLGFRAFKLQSSNFNLWKTDIEKSSEAIIKQLELNISHISPEAVQEAILFEILLKSGFELSTQINSEDIAGKTVFSVAEGELLVCLEKELTQELIKGIAEKKPSRVICLDEGFLNNDQLKTNAVQIMKSKGVIKFQTV
jgi:adenine-specific DNA-methyltransferase